jgi:predicted dehydrogenase/diketogulonate reductase-like aldo/keto reductase
MGTTMGRTVNWGILGAGAIAKAFAWAAARTDCARIVAVGSRSQEKAGAFGDTWKIPNRHGSYEALLADPAVQAVYIATPHPQHAAWAIRAAEAGKHVLCEKPVAVNHPQAMAMIDAADEHGVFFMEAFMYRCHPQTRRLVELLRERAIGDVCIIQATFSFQAGFNAESRLWKNDLAGGGIMDVGCYPVSMSRLLAGAATGKDFADPLTVSGAGKLHDVTKVDAHAVGVLGFPGGIAAAVATGIGVGQENVVRVFGTEGSLFVPNPWVAAREGGTAARIVVSRRGQKDRQEIVCDTPVTSFTFEVETASKAILAGHKQPPAPAMTWADSLGNIKTLDRWREAVGLTYEMEKPGRVEPAAGRPPARRPDAPIPLGRIPGLDKPVSRVAIGMDNTPTFTHWAVMLDDFFTRGGNCIDTAHLYAGGGFEKIIGQWTRQRNVRDRFVILDKGAHTPYCDPQNLSSQLLISLDRLETNVDIYLMHRDNPAVPVGEFVDVLNDHFRKGHVTVFGGSNWTIPRIEAANEYARRKGLQGFSVVSSNLCLAHMIAPVWDGCVHASDAESRAWFTRTQMPIMPWSSQGRGFFTERAAPGKIDEPEMPRCWYSEENFRRKARAEELAKKRGVLPIQIALAYVLCQPFPTFPLIGPRTLGELRSSLVAFNVRLSPEELRWLSGG